MNSEKDKAITLYEKKDYQNALSYFDRALILDNKDADLFFRRGVCKFHLTDLDGSFEDLNLALSLEPNNPFRYSSRAFIRDANGDTEGAIVDYETATLLDPEDAIAQNNLGILLEKRGKVKKAQDRFRKSDLALGRKSPEQEKIKKEGGSSKILNLDPPKSKINIMGSVFYKKSTFIEFLNFIRKGFKMK